ncbi:hypothetical protein HPB48_010212 [Haemaphysalis longicornis]|uniref:CCHC-type domain-containing protein n=1 Tax=Haemaphysalis longicornis TaxID=44386 RepID=A0A9J6GHE2_HAELO|nr:hypothetical protein HPB48_010212 [Haemaphysalis longicornis]
MTTATGYDPDTMQVVEIQTSPTNQPVFDEFTEYVIKKKTERQQERLQQAAQLRQDGVTTGMQRTGNAHRRRQTPRSPSWKPAFMPKLGINSVVVIKPTDKINLAAYKGTNKLGAAISTATGISLASHEFTIWPAWDQNIIILGVRTSERIRQVLSVRELIIDGVRRGVQAHLKPAEDTFRGVINVDPAVTEQDISGVIYSPEAQILNIRKLGQTNVAVLTFEGRKVPRHIFYWNEAIPVRLYRKTTPACPRCGAVGHRADVCPTPNAQRCRACGEAKPGLEHNCTPTCLICGDSHLTGSADCAAKFRHRRPGTVRNSGTNKNTNPRGAGNDQPSGTERQLQHH